MLLFSCTSTNHKSTFVAKPQNKFFKNHQEAIFWTTFFEGDYAGIDSSLTALTKVYQINSNPFFALNLAQLYFWKYAERFRDVIPANPAKKTLSNTYKNSNRQSIEFLLLSKYYFAEAQKTLQTKQITAWQYSIEWLIADYFKAYSRKRQIWQQVKKQYSKNNFFEFFSAGYVMLNESLNSVFYQEFIQLLLENLRQIFDVQLDLKSESFRDDLQTILKSGKRTQSKLLSNSFGAPYSFEGFLLILADSLTKSGQLQPAFFIYDALYSIPNSSNWPLQSLLDSRLKHIKKNHKAFARNISINRFEELQGKHIIQTPKQQMAINRFNCMVCHQSN